MPPTTPFSVRLRFTGRRSVDLRLSGELDHATAASVGDVVELVRSLSPEQVDVDLSGVTFVDLGGWRGREALLAGLADMGAAVTVSAESAAIQHLRDVIGRVSRPEPALAAAGPSSAP